VSALYRRRRRDELFYQVFSKFRVFEIGIVSRRDFFFMINFAIYDDYRKGGIPRPYETKYDI